MSDGKNSFNLVLDEVEMTCLCDALACEVRSNWKCGQRELLAINKRVLARVRKLLKAKS